MSIPIDIAGIVTALVAAGVIGIIASILTLYVRLYQLPELQRETIEEVRLLRLTIERMVSLQSERHQRWSP